MEHVAHQCICMQYILELSKQLDVDPRACVGSFFSRIQTAEVEYKNSFDDELRAFKDRIRKRAAEKVAEAVREAEEEERKARLGPGGLDPVEVFESLPEVNENSRNNKSRFYSEISFLILGISFRLYKNASRRKIFPYCNKQ